MGLTVKDILSAKSIALYYSEAGSNKIPYVGSALFPAKKKAGLDLKWFKNSKGLPVSLAPAAFDTKATIRSRGSVIEEKTEMALFRESFIVKESDEQDLLRAQEASDPYATAIIDSLYADSESLIAGANVVPERMIMQLLSSAGSPTISISANGVTYAYNYDPDGSYQSSNYTALSGTSKWTDTANSKPLDDIRTAQESVEEATGTRPDGLLVSQKTMGYLLSNASLKSAILSQNVSANVFMTEARVKAFIFEELGVTILKVTKLYKNEAGTSQKFFPDDIATLIPLDGQALGYTWYGTTAEERVLMGNAEADVALINQGVAVTTYTNPNPVHTEIIASEIVLPSFERMDETYKIKVN